MLKKHCDHATPEVLIGARTIAMHSLVERKQISEGNIITVALGHRWYLYGIIKNNKIAFYKSKKNT